MRICGSLPAACPAVVLALLLAACGDDATTNGPAVPDVTLTNLNLVHGLFCPPETDSCRLPDRVDLLMEWIAVECPDLVTLQEIWPPSLELIEERAGTVCPFPYNVLAGESASGVDDELVLSRYPATIVDQLPLYIGFRRVLWTQIDHPTGLLDVYSTHLASGADGGPDACGDACPPECRAAGAQTVRECQSVQTAEFIERTHTVPGPALVSGDMNARPGSFVYRQFTDRGWLDSYLETGNPECAPATGIGCTSGRESELLHELEAPELNLTSRIDYVFLIPAADGSACRPTLIGPGPGGTGLWDDRPNPFAADCGPLPDPICWASDHMGVRIGYTC